MIPKVDPLSHFVKNTERHFSADVRTSHCARRYVRKGEAEGFFPPNDLHQTAALGRQKSFKGPA